MSVKIVALSDTHTKHKKLAIPECDILIHCGDFSWTGKYYEVTNFLRWFQDQPAKHKILIAGNHEETFDSTHKRFMPHIPKLLENYDINYLENSSVTIEGIKFYGTPWTPRFYDWGFNGLEGPDAVFQEAEGNNPHLRDIYSKIPDDTNVLICHGPTYNVLDMNDNGTRCGSVEMSKLLDSGRLAQLHLYLCGHIHEARGHDIFYGGINFCNVSSLGRDYETVSPPVTIYLDESGSVNSVEGYEK
jgi:Icc-related predicted phosphoesterase